MPSWRFVAYIYDGTMLTTYVDGANLNWAHNLGSLNTVGSSARIGRHVGGSSTPFAGDLDELRIYDRALGPEDIQALYDAVEP